jgi:hypothetical protein
MVENILLLCNAYTLTQTHLCAHDADQINLKLPQKDAVDKKKTAIKAVSVES